jgi:transcriptional regulator with XRE-family HTH domain
MPDDALKAMRLSRGLTLRDVEAITDGGISNAYLSQLENGKIKRASFEVALMLSAAYAVSMDELAPMLCGIPKPPPSPICRTCGRTLLPEISHAG